MKEEYIKGSGTGRGGWRGGGRPKGTIKEVKKKMYSFRLSIEEADAVKSLLKKMRAK